jgi:cytosine deaminase
MEDHFLEAAIEEARQGMREGGIPIGSVIAHGGKIIGRGHNRRVQRKSAILHGEMDALENAGRQSASVYRESVLIHDAFTVLHVFRCHSLVWDSPCDHR